MRDYAVEYLNEVQKILTRVLETQTEAIHTAAEWIVDATLAGKKLWAVGCGAGGLARPPNTSRGRGCPRAWCGEDGNFGF